MYHLKIGQALVGHKGNPRIQGGPTEVLPPKRLPKCALRSAAHQHSLNSPRVLVRLDHVASRIVNTYHSMM